MTKDTVREIESKEKTARIIPQHNISTFPKDSAPGNVDSIGQHRSDFASYVTDLEIDKNNISHNNINDKEEDDNHDDFDDDRSMGSLSKGSRRIVEDESIFVGSSDNGSRPSRFVRPGRLLLELINSRKKIFLLLWVCVGVLYSSPHGSLQQMNAFKSLITATTKTTIPKKAQEIPLTSIQSRDETEGSFTNYDYDNYNSNNYNNEINTDWRKLSPLEKLDWNLFGVNQLDPQLEFRRDDSDSTTKVIKKIPKQDLLDDYVWSAIHPTSKIVNQKSTTDDSIEMKKKRVKRKRSNSDNTFSTSYKYKDKNILATSPANLERRQQRLKQQQEQKLLTSKSWFWPILSNSTSASSLSWLWDTASSSKSKKDTTRQFVSSVKKKNNKIIMDENGIIVSSQQRRVDTKDSDQYSNVVQAQVHDNKDNYNETTAIESATTSSATPTVVPVVDNDPPQQQYSGVTAHASEVLQCRESVTNFVVNATDGKDECDGLIRAFDQTCRSDNAIQQTLKLSTGATAKTEAAATITNQANQQTRQRQLQQQQLQHTTSYRNYRIDECSQTQTLHRYSDNVNTKHVSFLLLIRAMIYRSSNVLKSLWSLLVQKPHSSSILDSTSTYVFSEDIIDDQWESVRDLVTHGLFDFMSGYDIRSKMDRDRCKTMSMRTSDTATIDNIFTTTKKDVDTEDCCSNNENIEQNDYYYLLHRNLLQTDGTENDDTEFINGEVHKQQQKQELSEVEEFNHKPHQQGQEVKFIESDELTQRVATKNKTTSMSSGTTTSTSSSSLLSIRIPTKELHLTNQLANEALMLEQGDKIIQAAVNHNSTLTSTSDSVSAVTTSNDSREAGDGDIVTEKHKSNDSGVRNDERKEKDNNDNDIHIHSKESIAATSNAISAIFNDPSSIEARTCCASILNVYHDLCNVDVEEDISDSRLFFCVAIMACCGVVKSLIRYYRILWLPEAAGCILVGVASGYILNFFPHHNVSFDGNWFLRILVPPIIFEAALSIDKRSFNRHLVPIIIYSVAGTIIATFLTAIIVHYGTRVLSPLCMGIPFVEALTFGALISSIDPIAVLSVLSNMGMTDTDTIYVLIFGESLLNDGVAIVLFHTLVHFLDENLIIDQQAMHEATIHFLVVAVGSLLVGVAAGIMSTLFFWTFHGCQTPMVEVIVFFCWALLPYYVCDGIGWSGIVAAVAVGFFMDVCVVGQRPKKNSHQHQMSNTLSKSMLQDELMGNDDTDRSSSSNANDSHHHYQSHHENHRRRFSARRSIFNSRHGHLSIEARTHIGFVAEIISTLMETAIFAYLGFFLLSHRYHWNVFHIFIAILACCASRAIMVPMLGSFSNWFTLRLHQSSSKDHNKLWLPDETCSTTRILKCTCISGGLDGDRSSTRPCVKGTFGRCGSFLGCNNRNSTNGNPEISSSSPGILIDRRMQIALWFAGLRGAMSFALVEHIPLYDSYSGRGSRLKPELKAMTSASIMFTVFVLGGYTYYVMEYLGITPKQKNSSSSSSVTKLTSSISPSHEVVPLIRQVDDNHNNNHHHLNVTSKSPVTTLSTTSSTTATTTMIGTDDDTNQNTKIHFFRSSTPREQLKPFRRQRHITTTSILNNTNPITITSHSINNTTTSTGNSSHNKNDLTLI